MKPLQEIFPPKKDETDYSYEPWLSQYSYDAPEGYEGPNYVTLVKSMDIDVIRNKQVGMYQGDGLFVVKRENEYGWLVFGYGSCSGCDALEGCSTYEELEQLRENMFNNIRWFPSLDELLNFLEVRIKARDMTDDELDMKKWSTAVIEDYYWYDRDTLDAVKEMVESLLTND